MTNPKTCPSCGRSFVGESEVCPACEAAQAPELAGDVSRRKFLSLGVFGIAGGIGVAYLGMALRYLLPNQAAASGGLQDMGPVSDFPVGTAILRAYMIGDTPDGVYILNTGKEFLCFDFHCTHLQCPVHWSAGNFYCPCHGSVFNSLGQRIAGPAPRPLHRHYITVRNGRVLVGGIIS